MKRTLYSGVGLLLVGLLFLAFNLRPPAAARPAVRPHQQKLYTFSAGTQEVLDSLDEPLNLYLFFSKAAPVTCPPCATTPAASRKCWTSMHGGAMAMSDCSVIDPLPFSDDEDRAARFGLQAPPIGPNGEAIYFGLAATNPTTASR
ncbi:Gldg family protein [Pseudomonas aeruginosa]|uniref:DUF7088 domain-containing protein n=1 Tax=Pseudomonas aeruginosa TaxID=287 RepID=UPI00048A258D